MIWLHVRYGGWIVGFGSCIKSLVNKVITTTIIPVSSPHVIHLEENRNVNVTSNNRGLVLSNITTQRLAINYNGFSSNGMQLQAAFIIAQYHTERNLHLDNWNFLCYTIFHQNIKRLNSKSIVIRVAFWLRYWFHYALGWRSLFGYERYQKCDSKPQIDEIAHATLLFYWLRFPACSETTEMKKVVVSGLYFGENVA